MPTADHRTYRYPTGAVVTMAVCALCFAGGVAVGIAALVLEDSDAAGIACICGFGGMFLYTAWLAAEYAWTRVEVGYDWIRKRSLRGTCRVAFAEIVAFSEVRGLIRHGRHGSEFRLYTSAGPRLTFTTYVVGWAAIVETLHQSIPWRVPPAASLRARTSRNDTVVDPFSAAFVAPGQPIPEEWARPGRVRFRDALLAQVAAFCLVAPPVVWLVLAAQSRIGRHAWLDLLTIVVAVGGSQLLGIVLTEALRRRRVRRAQRSRLFTADDAERVISPGFAERQRRG